MFEWSLALVCAHSMSGRIVLKMKGGRHCNNKVSVTCDASEVAEIADCFPDSLSWRTDFAGTADREEGHSLQNRLCQRGGSIFDTKDFPDTSPRKSAPHYNEMGT